LFQDDAGFCPFDGTPLTKSTDPLLGRTIAGRFRLIKRLGAGGMSSVYLARHVMIDRLNAIKILRPELSLNPRHRERFLREARAVNRINHRNIVEITDFGDTDNLAYLVMEYVDGASLIAHLRSGRFSWQRAAHIAAQVASALGRAHQMGIIHRDLKPENILLVGASSAAPDIVKLTDFGIAKILDAPALTFQQQMFGTPGYIAPEYLEGLPPDGRADLYALGVVMYEMMAGTLPYDARGQSELLFKPLEMAPVPLHVRGFDVPPDIEALVLALLARQRADRPADAFVVHDALTLALGRATLGSPRPGTGASAGMVDAPIALAQTGETVADSRIGEDEETVTAHFDAAAMDAAVRDSEVTPLAIDAAIASMAARDDALTLIDDEGFLVPSEPPRTFGTAEEEAPTLDGLGLVSTARLGRQGSSALAVRWNAALDVLEVAIARALSTGGERAERAERAKTHAEAIRGLIASVEKATLQVAEYQGSVDRLAAEGRAFRSDLGRAIDEVSHEQSRERMHLTSIRARRRELEEARAQRVDHAASQPGGEGESERAAREAEWEEETLRAADERSVSIDAELEALLEARKRELEARNERLDHAFAEATGLLEGAISAVRRLTHELVRALDDAAALVTAQGDARRKT